MRKLFLALLALAVVGGTMNESTFSARADNVPHARPTPTPTPTPTPHATQPPPKPTPPPPEPPPQSHVTQ